MPFKTFNAIGYSASDLNAYLRASTGGTNTWSVRAICPDLLRLEDIGEADGWRGHLVRGFFRVLKWITGV